MPRSGEQSRSRLRQAAFELFAEHGFDAVTTADIARQAGLTERTYFRHYPDKREVLFDGESMLSEWLSDAVADIPQSVPPMMTLRRAFLAIVPLLEGNRANSERLAHIVAATPALWERAAAKEWRLVGMLADLLHQRGHEEDVAAIAARTGWGVLAHAMSCWQADADVRLEHHIERAFAQFRTLAVTLQVNPRPRR